MKPPYFTDDQRDFALSELDRHKGDLKAAAKFAKVPVEQLRKWAKVEQQKPQIISGRPMPPASLLEPLETEPLFSPAHDLTEWIRGTFLDESSTLFNSDHLHLVDASIGMLWTNVENFRQGRHVVGTAGQPQVQGDRWTRARSDFQLAGWFGQVPDFLITIDAPYASQCPDASFCALLEHEMYHCGQAINAFGEPAFNKDGFSIFCIRGHDVEEFTGVVRRYGPGASAGGVKEFVEAANRGPLIARADISHACGTCLRKAA